jgi:G:T/U-mismatch repair DNA glycosylase
LIKRPKKEDTSIKIGTIILHQRNIFKLINLLKIKEQKPLLLSNPTYRVKLGPANWKKGVKIIGNQDPNLIRLLFDDGTSGDYPPNNCIQMEEYEEINWFNFTEDCVPDYLHYNLDILFIGYNPGLMSAAKKHHYSNPTNHFWKLLNESGLIEEKVTHEDDVHLVEKYNMGLTNIVVRKSRGTDELTTSEMKEGGELLRKKIQQYKPKIVCFNGKQVFTYFARVKNVEWGRQPKMNEFGDTELFVVPSTSGRVTHFTKKDKLAFFVAMKKTLEELKNNNNDNVKLTDPSVVKEEKVVDQNTSQFKLRPE